MAGTVNISYQEHRTVRKITFDWLSDAAGAADATTKEIYGQILRVIFKPDGGGTQPTDLYDITLKDEHGVDVLQGLGANLSNVNTIDRIPQVSNGTSAAAAVAVADKLALAVTNAGNAKGGELIIYYG